MNKTAIQIKMIALWTVILLFTACQDDMPFRNTDRIQEGIPTTVKLGFQASEATVETRAAQDRKYEDRVDNVFILIFDEDGKIHDRFFCKDGSGLSYDNGNTLLSSGILTFTTTSLNNATIVGIANLADGNTSTAYTVTEAELTAVNTLDELKALSAVCRKHKIPLFLDGARLGYGLAARDTDVTLKDIASLCDIFYIGGTKVGALFGEAVVIPQPGLIRQFDTIVKQRGVLLAKGRLLGLQFDTLFTDGLYLKIARHAIDMADRIVEGLKVNGYTFYIRPQSNQLFVQLENSLYEKLAQRIGFEVWEKRADGTTVVRIATSWATREEDVAELLEELKNK